MEDKKLQEKLVSILEKEGKDTPKIQGYCIFKEAKSTFTKYLAHLSIVNYITSSDKVCQDLAQESRRVKFVLKGSTESTMP